MSLPRIHLIAPAGSCKPFFEAMGVSASDELVAHVQAAVGSSYRVTGNAALIEADEDESRGGRTDDQSRAADIVEAFTDDEVAGIVLLRGGAWFTRVLPLIDFSVLDHRARPVAVFGFSELTTLVNIVGAYKRGLGVYDMGPAFLTYGLKRYAYMRDGRTSADGPLPGEWMRSRLRPEFDRFFQDVVGMIEGRGSDRAIAARLVRGNVPDSLKATFVGGNLTVLSTMIGSAYDEFVRPVARWLVLEDFNDKLERFDRFLAHLTLARYWDGCEGVLLGDFHKGYEDLACGMLELLEYHMSPTRPVPVLVTRDVGHVWPMAPLPLHAELRIQRTHGNRYVIHWPGSTLRTV